MHSVSPRFGTNGISSGDGNKDEKPRQNSWKLSVPKRQENDEYRRERTNFLACRVATISRRIASVVSGYRGFKGGGGIYRGHCLLRILFSITNGLTRTQEELIHSR
jgi:hypothetical protein